MTLAEASHSRANSSPQIGYSTDADRQQIEYCYVKPFGRSKEFEQFVPEIPKSLFQELVASNYGHSGKELEG